MLPLNHHRPALTQCRLGPQEGTAEACEDVPSSQAVSYQDSRASANQSAPPQAFWEPGYAGADKRIFLLSTWYCWSVQPNLIANIEGLAVSSGIVAIFLFLLLVPHLTPHILVSRLETVSEVYDVLWDCGRGWHCGPKNDVSRHVGLASKHQENGEDPVMGWILVL